MNRTTAPTRAESHRAAANGLPDATCPAELAEAQVAALAGLDLHELRVRWRKMFRSTAPEHLPRYLLLRILAYKLQAKLLGDLDPGTLRFLRTISQRGGRGKGRAAVPPVPEVRSLKSGTVLVREHGGTLHRVTVVDGGFHWGEGTYASLSEVARAITGTRWNGPRFFGLRDGPVRSMGGQG